MLDARGRLDVVFACQARSRRSARRDPEVRVATRADFVVLGDAVAIRVIPGARISLRRERIVAFGPAAGPGEHVLAHARLERRSCVAAEVVHHGEARRDVVPVRHTPHGRFAERCDKTARAPTSALDFGVEVVEAQSGTDREPPKGPGVLGVNSNVPVDVLVVPCRRVVDGHRERDAIGVVLHDVAIPDLRIPVYSKRPLHAGFECM